MKLNEIKAPEGRKHAKRVGRGTGSGLGKTSGKGGKGQTARTGKGKPGVGYEGGQMPMYRRIPKRGFCNIFAKDYNEVSVCAFEKFDDGTVITAELLKNNKVIKSVKDGIRVLGNGNLTKKLTVQANHVTASAKEKIEKAGGSVIIIGQKESDKA